MKAVVQRVKSATLTVDGKLISSIENGLVVFLGVKRGDTEENCLKISTKIANLRIFEDSVGKMNLSVKDVNGEILLVSQFTLYGDTSRGNRPNFSMAEEPVRAKYLYEECIKNVRDFGIPVKTGVFGADMKILQLNDGPVSIEIEI